ncbi:hypothetical protein BDK88_3870 [Natrinema hispanicum]|uniref:Big-1 domain-containing protein n=1 Tax=Natrinema hispanicum TaxID=392421 RepID=A0A482Y5Q1_9EURY|nr:hypothetical protein [Natrinema hispanicum]RZV06321.1 hypothetical protein BDK88_3870 [Natrinema hispanicum]
MNRDSVGDERAVSPLIGAILLLAILMTMLALLQLNAVPALVSEAEFNHNQRVQGEMRDVAAGIDRSVATGTSQSIALTPGVRYQSRLFLLNPPPATGTVRTGEPENVTIENAVAQGETGDYWDGSPNRIETQPLIYTPEYNEYHDAPQTVYELGTVYNRIGETTLVTDGHQLIDGRTITLTTLRGEVSHTGVDRTLLKIRPSSPETRSVLVSGRADDPPKLTVPTELTKEQWDDLLKSELTKNGGYVTDYTCETAPPNPCDKLTITLQASETYEMQLAQVWVDDDSVTRNGIYLTDVEGSNVSVPAGGRQRLITEVRDKFDNPVSGVSVEAKVSSGQGIVSPVEQASGTDGRMTFIYEAPDDISKVQNVTVVAEFGGDDKGQNDKEKVGFELQVWGESGNEEGPDDDQGPPEHAGPPTDSDGEEELDDGEEPGNRGESSWDRGRPFTFEPSFS